MSFYKHLIPLPERLAEMGFRDAAAAGRNLEALGTRLGPEAGDLFSHILSLLSRSADPDMAANNLERFFSGIADVPSFVRLCRARHEVLLALITALGASRFLATLLISRQDEQLALLADPSFLDQPWSLSRDQALLARAASAEDERVVYQALRTVRRQAMLRIGLRDLLGKAGLQETVGDLTVLAEDCLQTAYAWARMRLLNRHGRPVIEKPDGSVTEAGFAVIAMGKLGGQELNFSSDVDLMYVYRADGETEGVRSAEGTITNRITNHQFFVKLAEKISAAIGEKTEDGFVFRVDLRLRPEGQRGPLAQSLGGYEIYYESWGQTWERAALIKARPVAGDEAVGGEFLARIAPFVYRKYLDYSAIHEIRGLKQKINRDAEQKGRAHRDVKLGYGGIREIEFIIQAIQLIYGGRDRSLRERNTMKALHMLSQKGLITYQEQDVLSRAYVFLRNLEHRIQILDDLQTQTMPVEGPELRSLARRAGYLDPGREEALLLQAHREHTEGVRSVYDDLFAFSGEAEVPGAADSNFAALLDPETSEQEAVNICTRLGFQHPGKAYRNLLMIREGTAFVHQTPRSRRLFHVLFPSLLRLIVASPDPDGALHHLESFLSIQGSWEAFQAFAGMNASVPAVLVAVFANSEYLSRVLISRPQLIQNLLEARMPLKKGSLRLLTEELDAALRGCSDVPGKLDALRRFKNQEEMRIGMADLLSGMNQRAVFRELSKLAEVCLDATLALAAEETARRYGMTGSIAGLAVIGVGKLGGRELSYGSDLDILFAYDTAGAAASPDGITVSEYFSKVAEKTIAYLTTMTREGFLFRVDTRLRPSGSKGPLVTSLEACSSYYSDQAETWELQALLRARCVAGDRRAGRKFCSLIRDVLFRPRDRQALQRDIQTMRARMVDELGKDRPTHYNIKQGAGGIVDIEFIVQYLQLCYGGDHPRLRIAGTENALRALRALRIIDAGAVNTLRHAYALLRRIESRLRIVSNQAASELSRDPAGLRNLARRMGYDDAGGIPAGARLLAEYENEIRRVRSLYSMLLNPEPGLPPA